MPALDLLEICRTHDGGENYLDSETGNIYLTKIASENSWYRVVLSCTAANQYGIDALIPLGEIMSCPKPDYGHAYFGNLELLIPFLRFENHVQAVKMQLIPGMDWQFRMMENVKRH